MPLILGCRVAAPVLSSWSRRLVWAPEPLYLTPAHRSLLPAGTVLFTRDEFGRNLATAPLDLRDAYAVYQVRKDATHVALVSPAAMQALPAERRRELLHLQWHLGRGQIHDRKDVTAAVGDHPLLDECTFPTPDGAKVALRHDLWRAFSPTARTEWLVRFVSRDRAPCLSSSLDEGDWERLRQRHGPSVRRLAGTFSAVSGPNCFATALAAATPNPAVSASIAALWLEEEPFRRGLAERGLREQPVPDNPAEIPAGAVLAWKDGTGRHQHACYVLGGGLALNKDSQAWFTPRQILPLTAVLANWQDDGLTTTLYAKG